MALTQFQKRRRHVLAVLLIIAFAALLTVRSAWNEEVHEAIEMVGLALIATGILGRMWCTLYIGGRKAQEIVSAGPYSVSRNPLYFFSTVAAAGVGAQTGSLVLAVLFALGCAGAFLYVIRREERFLGEIFGTAYDDYRASVPRFWPRLAGFRDEAQVSVPIGRLYATLADGLVFFLAVPAFELIEWLQRTGILAVRITLY